MHGGVKIYRGSAAAARAYVEADRSRADDYYLAEGTGVAARYVASPLAPVRNVGTLTGDAYETWVAGYDPDTLSPKGRLRTDSQAVRFVEVVVNGPKTWSLAAHLHPQVAAAYDAAQEDAARQIIGWLALHATTRVGPRGRQVQLPVAEIEAAVVRHYTSRAGDPHRHLHLQINARVFAEGRWLGLHTVGVRDSLEAINGIGHAAMLCDPDFRSALAAHGYTIARDTGEIVELARFVGPFSARTAQIARNIDRYEAQWRSANPHAEPGPRLRRLWDARAWAERRPDKIIPTDGAELERRWIEELLDLGYRTEASRGAQALKAVPVGTIDRDKAVETVLSRLGARRSGWNAADIRGEVEKLIATTGIVTAGAIRLELAEDLTARTLEASVPLLVRRELPEHIRALSSQRVLDVESELVARIIARSSDEMVPAGAALDVSATLDVAQRSVLAALAGGQQLLVVEGAAGAGKTTALAAVRAAMESQGRRLVVVTPTLKAATVAAGQIGTSAFSSAWLAHQHGYRWNNDGVWWRLARAETDPITGTSYGGPRPSAQLRPGDLLLVDEAGMLDQDTARALLNIAGETGARLALVGDRHQLPAVGRGGVLDLAARWANPTACLTLDTVHRFADPHYARLSLAMRTGKPLGAQSGKTVGGVGEPGPRGYDLAHGRGEASGEPRGEVFDALWARGHIRLHASEVERTAALAAIAVASITSGEDGVLVIADTREQVADLNAAIRDQLVAGGHVDDVHAFSTHAGERVGVGDRVSTRRNDRNLDVANRDVWSVAAVDRDGTVTVTGRDGERILPADYARKHVELAYATTVYGAQGETSSIAHLVIGEHTGAAAAYVGMTRGREHNTAHLIAETMVEARQQWLDVFSRDRADLGPAHAARLAADEADRYGSLRPLERALADLRRAWTAEQDLHDRIDHRQRLLGVMWPYDNAAAWRILVVKRETVELTTQLRAAKSDVKRRLAEPAIRWLPPDRLIAERNSWLRKRRAQHQATRARKHAHTEPRTNPYELGPSYGRPNTGPGIGR